jgi:bicarbonate transport system substrate-binding protein
LGNPPSRTQSAGQPSPTLGSGSQDPVETTTIKLGYIPIVEAAPLIVAQEKGFFATYGMTGVEVSKQANWGAARDNVEIGSAGGGIDGGQWQMPMPYLISGGLITKNNTKIPMAVLAQLNTQGNGIAVANKHLGQGIGLDLTAAKDYIVGLKAAGTPFKAASTFPKANQDLWIRYWFAAAGIDPDSDVDLLVVPAAQTVANMKTGSMDAFSTGDPWPYRIITDQIGFMAALTSQIWPAHPEEYLAIRADWVDQYPSATKALLKAVIEAQRWCDLPENREELATILAGRNYFNLPVEILKSTLKGQYTLGDGKPNVEDFTQGPLYWKDDRGSVSYPYRSHDLWFLTESVRWGFLPAEILSQANQLIQSVNREDLWREAAAELGIPDSDIPSSSSRGLETFFDGITFDPDNPQAYLDSLAIKRI